MFVGLREREKVYVCVCVCQPSKKDKYITLSVQYIGIHPSIHPLFECPYIDYKLAVDLNLRAAFSDYKSHWRRGPPNVHGAIKHKSKMSVMHVFSFSDFQTLYTVRALLDKHPSPLACFSQSLQWGNAN